MKLAHLWGCPLPEAQQRINACQFAEELAYYELDPWGDERADLRAAQIAAMVGNASGNYRHAFKPADFMPDFDKPGANRMTDDQMLNVMQGFIARQKAHRARRGGA